MSEDKMVQLAVNTIHTLSIDAAQAARSGHPGGNGAWTHMATGTATGGGSETAPAKTEPPTLPWKCVKLDPLEVGRRAYRLYVEKGSGCGTASYLGLLGLLKEKVGDPWTSLPDMMISHAQAGYGGHGTLCRARSAAPPRSLISSPAEERAR